MKTNARASGGFVSRLWALVKKETRQLLRDQSNLLIGIGLPIALIFIFGYGVTLDVKDIKLAVVTTQPSEQTEEVVSAIRLSQYFKPTIMTSFQQAEKALRARDVEAIAVFDDSFAADLAAGQADVQLIVLGSDATRASSIRTYFSSLIGTWAQKQADRHNVSTAGKGVTVIPRIWFNDANTSTWFIVPGLIVLIMTLVGTFLTALVMAREWERGTLEALFVTPVRPTEIILAKIIPYFFVGIIGLVLCVLASTFLFHVPIHGSFFILVVGSVIYMLVALAIGLLISAKTRNQFLASQMAILVSFLPAMMLSGFVFDLGNLPTAVKLIGLLLPATYFIELLRTVFLAGNFWPIILKDLALLTLYAVVLLGLARMLTKKTLD
ncbi:ABC transporter permease [Alteromonas sp. C1M14]|uniref:ABC transporter permease n=1 Tax=Alteromonas sp. C1M14 TaxID=2841567 RepID=UPI001C08F21B|nr:ABC transporter permease [Alteromonas sp. C1M14]MBU2977778.1 ABC transporter permease [Alteromonas sp. C1M14]